MIDNYMTQSNPTENYERFKKYGVLLGADVEEREEENGSKRNN